MELNICSVWKDLDFRVDYKYAMLPAITTSTISAFVSCCGHKTVVEESVNVSLSLAGETLDTAKNSKYLPKIYGGTYNLSTVGDTDLTVLGGSWSAVIGGSHEAYMMGGTNLTLGGKAVAHTPSDAQAQAALNAARAVGATFAGVDILFGPDDEPLVCEVNSNPHFRSTLNATGVNLAEAIADRVLQNL